MDVIESDNLGLPNSQTPKIKASISSIITSRGSLRNGFRCMFSMADDEVYTFTWEEYLLSTGSVAAPPDLFKKVRKPVNGQASNVSQK